MKNADGEPRSTKTKKRAHSNGKKSHWRWVITIFCATIVISITFSFVSSQLLSNAGYMLAFAVLFLFILIGILFDIIGVAVTAATVKPFHSMAARKVPGAIEALRLLRNAEKVSNFCNDVVGDVCGIISGTTSAVIVSRLIASFSLNELIFQLLMSGMVAGVTVGGKALGKSAAITHCTTIVHWTARVIYFFKTIKKKVFMLSDRKEE